VIKDNQLIFKNHTELSRKLAQDILLIAEKSISLKDEFKIVLTGGRSVADLYEIFIKADSNWDKWHIYISDERCLPAENKDRNDHIINNLWLKHSPIPKNNIHFIRAELGMVGAQVDYTDTMKHVGKIDVVLLSVGEDGHTASLFPNHKYSTNDSVVLEYDSPKYPKESISLSYGRLNNSRYVFKIISGYSKKDVVRMLFQDEDVPINNVNGDKKMIFICKDAMHNQSNNFYKDLN
jgi:6-phosphogluconolactonase